MMPTTLAKFREMKIIGIQPSQMIVVAKYPTAFSGFSSGFPIEVVEVDKIDDLGEKLIRRADDDRDDPKSASKCWFEIEE